MTTIPIGVPVDLSKGTFNGTEYTNNKLHLKIINSNFKGTSNAYKRSGTWVSEVIDLVDRYTELQNLSMSINVPESTSYKAYTKTSDNNADWEPFVEIDYSTGKMNSGSKRYIQIKIEMTSEALPYEDIALTFKKIDITRLDTSRFVTTDNDVLALKKSYSLNMSDTNADMIFESDLIENSKFKKIDKIRLSVNGNEV